MSQLAIPFSGYYLRWVRWMPLWARAVPRVPRRQKIRRRVAEVVDLLLARPDPHLAAVVGGPIDHLLAGDHHRPARVAVVRVGVQRPEVGQPGRPLRKAMDQLPVPAAVLAEVHAGLDPGERAEQAFQVAGH